MLKIRLSRTGKKSQPSFRVLVQEHTTAVKGGKVVENLGYYKHAADPKEFKVNLDRIKYWLSVGAQPSDSVAVLLKNEGVDGMDKFIAPRDKQRKKKKEVEEAPVPATETAPAKEENSTETAPSKEPKQESKEEPKQEPKEESKEEPKQESKEEPKQEAKEEAPAKEEKTEEKTEDKSE